MKEIKLNKEISIDTQKLLQSRMVILANSGGGKSYAIRKFAEGAVGEVQTIIIDPEGEFASLREKYDFILAGKGADVPVEVRSAALLATKLLELGKSAVIDLYELHPQERQRYVKLFCDALVNAPKELYHPVFIVLDEAHEYAPEGKPSEATYAVEALASRGRKRGFCLIPASQRISKLSKNVSAECNNKLIGRASQDIDMKRAGDELGFNKDRLIELRQLKPGEFFAFGPAISDEIVRVKIGEVHTTHAKVGYKGGQKTPPASAVIKKILGELADLPHEAEKEAKTSTELKAQLATARKRITDFEKKDSHHFTVQEKTVMVQDKRAIDEAVKKAVKDTQDYMQTAFWSEREEWLKQIENWFNILKMLGQTMTEYKKTRPKKFTMVFKSNYAQSPDPVATVPGNPAFSKEAIEKIPDSPGLTRAVQTDYVDMNGLTGPEKRILDAIAWANSIGIEKPENSIVAFLSGYTNPKSTGYTNPRGSLVAKGLIYYPVPGSVCVTALAIGTANFPDRPGSEEELHNRILERLTGPQARILKVLIEARGEPMTNDVLAQQAGYANPKSTGYTNPRGELRSFGLIDYPTPGMVVAKSLLFP